MIVKKVATKKGAPARSRARHVRDLCNYIAGPEAGDRDEKVEHRGALNFLTLDHDSQVQEMTDLAGLSRLDSQPLQHWILSWRSGEQPTTKQADEAARSFLGELGLAEHQAMYALHRDTDNWHLHLAINRVHPDTERLVTVNGGFDIEVAHRAIASIEHRQGWESEPRARYRVNQRGLVERRTDDLARDTEPSTRARDLENRTGEKSAQRTAIEEGADLMRQARTWTELHALLAERGLRLEKKGSGAVLWVGDTAVKASTAGRDCSLSALQKKFGDYTPGAENSPVKPRAPEPVSPALGRWPRYAAERRAHQDSRERDRQLFEGRTRAEWSTLLGRQRQERRQTLTGDWQGKGAALNALRSIVAARQAQEKAAVKERHRRERRQWRERHAPWPAFEDWLRLQNPTLADEWRFRERAPAVLTGDSAQPATPRDIRAFSAEAQGWQVLYRAIGHGSSRPAFVDRGRQISVYDFEPGSVLAALQLASQKWGMVRVSGPENFRNLCARLAADHGFKLTNPDLQQAIRRDHLAVSHAGDGKVASAAGAEPGFAVGPSLERPRSDSWPPPMHPLARDVAEAFQEHLDHLRRHSGERRDASRVDGLVAIRLRTVGYTRVEIECALRDLGALQRDEVRDWQQYAKRAVDHAFGPAGSRYPEALRGWGPGPSSNEEPLTNHHLKGNRDPTR